MHRRMPKKSTNKNTRISTYSSSAAAMESSKPSCILPPSRITAKSIAKYTPSAITPNALKRICVNL